jgi:hypothetical protein
MNRWLNCGLVFALVALCACACACASTTQVTSRWQRPGYASTGFKKLAVVAWTGPKDTRRSIENFILSELTKLGIAGVAVNDVFEELPTPDQADMIRERLSGMGVDGAITVRQVGRSVNEKKVAAIPANERYARDFFGSYGMYYEPAYEDNRSEVDTKFGFECGLYGLDGRGPVAIRDLTVEKTNFLEQLQDGSATLVASLNESGLLTGKK